MKADRIVSCGILLLILFTFVLGSPPCYNGGLYNRQFSSCYYFFPVSLTFWDAESICGGIFAHLLSVTSASKQQFITDETIKRFSSNDYWIGLQAANENSEWEWNDGSCFNFSGWIEDPNPGPPSNFCAYANTQTGFWNPANCDSKKFFICEGTPQSETNPAQAWYFNVETKSYYKIVRTELVMATWTRLEESCRDENGLLTSIHSEDENNFVYRFAFEYSDCGYVAIGLQFDTDLNDFHWIDGSDFNYTRWQPGQPSSGTGNDCVALQGAQEWVNIPCDFDAFRCAVCKREKTCDEPALTSKKACESTIKGSTAAEISEVTTTEEAAVITTSYVLTIKTTVPSVTNATIISTPHTVVSSTMPTTKTGKDSTDVRGYSITLLAVSLSLSNYL